MVLPKYQIGDRVTTRSKHDNGNMFTRKWREESHKTNINRQGTVLAVKTIRNKGEQYHYHYVVQWDHLKQPEEYRQSRLCLIDDSPPETL